MSRTRNGVLVACGVLAGLGPAAAQATVTDPWTKWVANPLDTTVRSLDFIGANLFAASESDGVYVSPAVNGPWTLQNNGLSSPTSKNVYQIVSNSGNLFAATSAGLFRSTGGTGAWTQIGIGDQPRRLDQGGIESIVFNSASDMVVAVAGASPSGIFYSSDSGDHWDKAGGLPVNEAVYYLTASPAGTPLYAAADDGVYISTNQGRSWTLSTDGIPPSESVFRIAVDPADPTHLYAATGSSVYRSYSGGVTWVDANGPNLPAAGTKRAFLLTPSYGQKRAIVGSEQGAWATIDDGDTWGAMSVDEASQSNEFGSRIIESLGVGFSPPSLMAGTRGFGVYSHPFTPVGAPGGLTVSPNSSLKPGQSLSFLNIGWTGTLPFFFTYQWKECTTSNASSCTTDIDGATGPTFVIPMGDAGSAKRYAVRVCAINIVSPVPVCFTSTPTSAGVANKAGTEPKPLSGASLTPSGASYPWDTVFTINPGTWRTEGSASQISPTFTYLWKRCVGSACSALAGQTGATYTAVPADVGNTIQGFVRGTNGGVSGEFFLAGTTFTIVEKTPVNTEKPTLVGEAYTGRTLSSTAGGWDGHNPSYTRRWFRCEADGLGCNPISGQTDPTYAVTAADLGKRLQIEITATQVDPSQNRVTKAYSDPGPVVTDPPVDPGGGGDGGGGGGGGSGGGDKTPPVLSAVKAASGTLTAAKPLKITLTSTEAGALQVVIQRLLPGRRSGKKCVKPTRKLRKHKQCVRHKTVAGFPAALKAGANTIRIRRKIGKVRLAKGRYRALLRPIDAAANKGAAKVVPFRVA